MLHIPSLHGVTRLSLMRFQIRMGQTLIPALKREIGAETPRLSSMQLRHVLRECRCLPATTVS